MPLTNKQYDAIMREYDQLQYQDYRQMCQRREEIFQKIPRVREIEEAISSISLAQAERLYDGDLGALEELKQKLSLLRREKESLLAGAGYSADCLEMQYQCPDCSDTGYIGRKKCHCFRAKEIRLLYSSSRLESMLEQENFSTLSFDVYDEEQKKAMPDIIRSCRQFVDSFDQSFSNLLLYGSVGTGKTFLSNCIAKELLDRGHSVIYFTSFQLFDLFSGTNPELRRHQDALLESDLLILDDMGTELPNSFTVSKLFQILNERALAKRSTVISTNLSLREFRDIYSERTFSRITSSYTLLKFCGSDIRIRKKISRSPGNALTI